MKPENKPLAHLDSKKLTWIAATLVAIVTFIVYLPALQNSFVNWDDQLYVYENQNIKSIDLDFFRWSLTAEVAALWHPLTMFSLAMDHAMWGLNPLGYHLTNILFHSFNTFLVFVLVKHLIERSTITNTTPPSPLFNKEGDRGSYHLIAGIVTALLFGIHPLRVESVVWVSERKDVLCAFFFLLSLLAYLRYTSAGGSKKRLFYVVSLVSFTLALMSKPMAVSLPVVLLILDFYPLNRLRGFRGVLAEKLPFLALSVLSSLVTVWIHHSQKALPVRAIQSAESILFTAHVAVRACIFYLAKMIVPFNLSPLYPRPDRIDLFTVEYIEYLGSFILLLLITYIAVRSLKRNRLYPAAWFYYIVTLIPVIGIVPVGSHAAADRYTYLPSLGPFLLAGIGIMTVLNRCSKKTIQVWIITVLLLISSILGIKTTTQISIWKDTITLWSHEIKIFPGLALPYYNRGTGYDKSGAYQEAVRDFSKAIEINHSHVSAYNNRGVVYGVMGDYQQAIKDFEKVIEFDPKNFTVYNNRGNVYYSMGNYSQAVEDYKKAVEFDPKNAEAYYNLGSAYSLMGNMEQALINYQKAAVLGLKQAQDYLKEQRINANSHSNKDF